MKAQLGLIRVLEREKRENSEEEIHIKIWRRIFRIDMRK